MDAIRKKMKSLKDETDSLNTAIAKLEVETKEYNDVSAQAEKEVRDTSNKVHALETGYESALDKLTKTYEEYEEKDILFKEVETDIASLARRIMLMEEEGTKSESTLATTVTKLATTSKVADEVLKKVKFVENKCLNNEGSLEELDKSLRTTIKMATDNEQRLDELTRKLGVQEDELKRSCERAELSENKLKGVEEELTLVGENMKQLETSAEKAVEREEKLKDKILVLQGKFKVAEGRYEYGEMNIALLNQRIDDIEDEIYREKLKIKKVSDELGDTFDDMLENY